MILYASNSTNIYCLVVWIFNPYDQHDASIYIDYDAQGHQSTRLDIIVHAERKTFG